MLTLRWLLGTVIVLGGGGFAFLCVVAAGFRKSFGASPVSLLLVIGPLLALGLLLTALIAPAQRGVLHAGALAAILLLAFAIWQLVAESATVMVFALLFLALWFVFYAQALKTAAA